jgi:hypothetical protein
VILIPASMISGLSPERIDASLAYELNHIRRNDYTINSIRTLIETIFFFHPAIWYISAQIRKERENACDDTAVESCERIDFPASRFTSYRRAGWTELSRLSSGSVDYVELASSVPRSPARHGLRRGA